MDIRDVRHHHLMEFKTWLSEKLVKTTKTHRVRPLPRFSRFDGMLEQMPKRLSPFVFTRSRDGKPYTPKNLKEALEQGVQGRGC